MMVSRQKMKMISHLMLVFTILSYHPSLAADLYDWKDPINGAWSDSARWNAGFIDKLLYPYPNSISHEVQLLNPSLNPYYIWSIRN